MANCEKVLGHPDKDEIVQRLLTGDSVKDVSEWLKVKYPNNNRRWISYLTLQRYRHEHLNLKGEVLREIKAQTQTLVAEKIEEQHNLCLRQSEVYQEAKTAVVTDVLKQDKLILDIHDKIWQRIRLLEQEAISFKNDSVIVEYLSQMRQLLADYHKMRVDWEKLSRKTDNNSTNVQVIVQQAEDQLSVVKTVVREILQELSPELIPIFVERLKVRLSEKKQERASANMVNVQVNNYAGRG